MYERFADYILKLAVSKKGNLYCLFSILSVHGGCVPDICRKNCGREVIWKASAVAVYGRSAQGRVLEKFKENREKTLLGFCVMGGSFQKGSTCPETG